MAKGWRNRSKGSKRTPNQPFLSATPTTQHVSVRLAGAEVSPVPEQAVEGDSLGEQQGPAVHSERSISVKQHNAQVHSLEKQLRDAKLQLAGTDKAVRAKAEEARIEIEYEWSRRQWAERQLAYYRRKLAKLRGGDQEARTAQLEEGQTLEESEDEEQPEENEGDEAAPTRYRPADGTMSYGLTMRSTSAREMFDALRRMCPGTAADVLARAAVRLKCSKELLQASSMARTIKDHDITILKESRAYIMANSLGPRVWARWQHHAQVSTSKLMDLRMRTGYSRTSVTVEAEDSSDEDEERDVLVPHSMHPRYEYPVGPKLLPIASERALLAENFDLRDGEGAVAVELPNKAKGANMSIKKALLKLIDDHEEAGTLTRSGQPIDGAEERHYCIYFLEAGDGFGGKGTATKIVRRGVSLISQSGNNCSPHDWLDHAAYPGKEDWDWIEASTSPSNIEELQEIERAGGVLQHPDGRSFHIRWVLGGDKPWCLDAAGKMNMNSTHPFIECTCDGKTSGRDYHQQGEHHNVDAVRAARLSHVCPEWRFKGLPWVPFRCEIDAYARTARTALAG